MLESKKGEGRKGIQEGAKKKGGKEKKKRKKKNGSICEFDLAIRKTTVFEDHVQRSSGLVLFGSS